MLNKFIIKILFFEYVNIIICILCECLKIVKRYFISLDFIKKKNLLNELMVLWVDFDRFIIF